MLKKMIVLAVAAITLLGFAGLSHAAGPEWPAKVKVGFIPTEGGSDTLARFQILTKHLEKVLGIEVEGFSASDYAGIITAMSHKHIDFAYYGPKSYTEAAEKANAQALVMELDEQGRPGYTGILIARKGSGIKTVEDAKGKLFAFTDPNSTSGFLVPNVLFARDMKVKPKEYFKEVRFSGSHGASILAVHGGSIEVAATNDIDMTRMVEKGSVAWEDFNILWKSDLIPGAPMTARADLPASLKAAFAGALLQVNSDKKALKKLGNGGYGFCDDTTYDIIRYLKRLKAQLAAK
jgi:phosphonate transport system substrate-binding protein